MVDTASLCDACSAVPFDAENPPFGNDTTTREWNLGRLAQIRKKTNCPLCRVVLHAVFEAERGHSSYLDPDQEVVLTWSSRYGPAGAFRTNGARSIDCCICFVNESNHLDASVSQVRSHLAVAESRLDLGRVLRWMSVCMNGHGNDCNPELNQKSPAESIIPGLEMLRLIDVIGGCLVETRSPCRYLTLSYVWGGVPNFRLTSSNKSSLMKPGVIQHIWARLPRTIQDAIDLVKAIGERFLWIDALCLMQNNPLDLQKGVDAMDSIYERAVMTIIAASGDNANAGLPGVREGSRRMAQNIEDIMPGIKLAVYNDLDHLLRPSTYNRRAWTFQEQLLSPRSLFFVDNQVYFRCREYTWSENCVDQFFKQNNHRYLSSMLQMMWIEGSPEQDYRLALFYYTKRALTDQGDVLNAMAGIAKRLSKQMKCRFFEGMPTVTWDGFMVFRAHETILRRRLAFPSYSWTGWIGGITFATIYNENDWLSHGTWIIWYKRSPSGTVSPVWDIMANESFPSADLDYIGYRQRSPFNSRHSLGFPTSRTAPTESLHFERANLRHPVLQFWTLAVYYTISDLAVFAAEAYILDNKRARCGSMYMDGYEESTIFETEGALEFIVLSEADRDFNGLSPSYGEDEVLSISDTWKYYYVLLLEWSGGIAERRGIGVISQKAVERSLPPGPIWKEIIMA